MSITYVGGGCYCATHSIRSSHSRDVVVITVTAGCQLLVIVAGYICICIHFVGLHADTDVDANGRPANATHLQCFTRTPTDILSHEYEYVHAQKILSK